MPCCPPLSGDQGHHLCGVHKPAGFSGAEGEHGVGVHLQVLVSEQESAGLACSFFSKAAGECYDLYTASVSNVEGEHKNGACQHGCSTVEGGHKNDSDEHFVSREFEQALAPQADALRLANDSSSHIWARWLSNWCFRIGPWANESVHQHFKSRILVF